MESLPQFPAASPHPTYKVFAPREKPLAEQVQDVVPVQAVPLSASGADDNRHLHELTPTASEAVPVTDNESDMMLDGSVVEIVTVGAVVSPLPPSTHEGVLPLVALVKYDELRARTPATQPSSEGFVAPT